ncbi:uncharacterized protein LOC121776669 [Salvia splendens]|uniref:uncharacterized protein LOC121776669 n=1 Tax=Salvia splendens TaxID=180675 RepID=UPI001C27BBCB|nr:uncharacterized protein LOC121776669 [Salvia splendens]
MVAIRQLAYGTTTDMLDEYLHVEETTGREFLKKFCRGVMEAFYNTYLRKPTTVDCQTLMNMHETVHGFPRILGSINCMHREWNNCPTVWRGQFTSAYKTISCTMDSRRALFAQRQEAARKDMERTFGVLQACWAIVKGPARFWCKEDIADVLYACIILHNMIVEHEGGSVTDWGDDEATPPHVRGLLMGYNEVLAAQASMCNQQDHARLMSDMVEEIWARIRS